MFAKRGIQEVDLIPGLLHIWGGDGDRDQGGDQGGDQTGDEQVQSGNTNDGDVDDDGDDQDSGADSGKDGKKNKEPSIEELLDAERRKNLKLQRDLNKAKTDKDAADADKDAAKERDTYKARLEKAERLIEDRLKIWSIETNKKYQWENAEDVLAFIKPDEIHIDLEADDPKVEGLDLALKRIAKEKPYLLKKNAGDKGDEGDKGLPSGSHPRNGKVTDTETEIQRLGEKFKIPGFGAQAIRPV